MRKSIKFIDLFAGIGGIRLGFQNAFGRSARCVFSSEWDKFSQVTYAENFGEIPEGDITEFSPQNIPFHDVLLAGFPCQPFSNAGLKKGFRDIRGNHFFHIASIIDYHKPAAVLLENVKGFKSHDKGRTFKIAKDTLSSIGYSVHDSVLNAKDFGLPQNRERIYLVCFRDKNNFLFPEPEKLKTRVGSVLERRVPNKYTISDTLWRGHQRRLIEHRRKGNGFGYSLFQRDSEYTSTISARYYKDGSEILIDQKNKNPRKITPREAARLQGFPDSFKIPVSDTQAYRQFGNSVAVPVIEAISKQIKNSLSNKSSSSYQESKAA